MLDNPGQQNVSVSVPSSTDLQPAVADSTILSTARSLSPPGTLSTAGLMDNGTGKKLMEVSGAALSKRMLLVGVDILCFFLASIPFFLGELKVVSPYRRGFTCGDRSIIYPYRQGEAIPDDILIAAGIVTTGLMIAFGECYRVHFQGISSKAFVKNVYVSCLYKELGCFLFGCCVGQSLTNMAKLSVGRLRPHFLSVCGITYTSLNCTPGTYVTAVSCLKLNQRSEDEARKSFFSGHASFAMYTMLYLAFYLQARFTWCGARLLRPLLQISLVLLALYTGLTRISEYRHHPSDVIIGYMQGAVTAYWVAFHISSMFKSSRSALSPDQVVDSPLTPHHTVC
ncbi:phospholipid phosphatase 3-like [Thalassophryne amazonica]|uniref:phospholipid phosphatase 3-like n=1 Tax=Thalassophryne amazonica TaxID=390379 RepID=UPI0014716312|nr:phospholipid phosphatase 3-like [Thalassophryne amazonica]